MLKKVKPPLIQEVIGGCGSVYLEVPCMLALHLSSSVCTHLQPQPETRFFIRWTFRVSTTGYEIKVLRCSVEACPGLSCPHIWRSSHHSRGAANFKQRAMGVDVLRMQICPMSCSDRHGPAQSQPPDSWLTASSTTSHFKPTLPTTELFLQLKHLVWGKGQQENSSEYKDTHPIGTLCAKKLSPQACTCLPLQGPFRS